MFRRLLLLALIPCSSCADPPMDLTSDSAPLVTEGPRPKPLFAPDLRWIDGGTIINHAYVQPTRATYDGRIAFESETQAKFGRRCFRVIRPEVLTGHLSQSVVELASPLAERFCLPVSTFHGSTAAGLLGIQGAVCDAAATQPAGRVDPLTSNRQPQPCAANPAADCYRVTTITHFEATAGPPNEVWSREFEITVTNPKTPTARITAVTPLGVPQKSLQGGTIIEPVLSGDGRLFVYHDGRTIKYAVSPPSGGFAPCDARGFKPARSISHMFWDPDMAPYGIARFQLRDSENRLIADDAEVGGAYPWIDRNGSNLFITTGGNSLYYMNAAGVIKSRYPVLTAPVPGASPNPPTNLTEIRAIGDVGGRNGIMVMGLWTQGKMVVLDNRINNSDLAILDVNPAIHDRNLDLYASTPGGTRIGASNSFFINSLENVLNHDPDLRPITPRDVVWQVAATTGTAEVAFDDFLLKRMLIFSPMNPTVANTAPALHSRDYVDGFRNTGQFRGEGFLDTPHVQNAAATTYWTLPSFGSLLGGARVEPVAAGGVTAKGIHLDGLDDRIEYPIPAQSASRATDMATSAWMYSLWLNPTTALSATQRLILTTPDGTQVLLTAARVLIRRGAETAAITVPIPIRLAPTRYSHLAIVSRPSGAGSSLALHLDGFLLATVATTTPMLRLSGGAGAQVVVGTTTAAPGFIGWIDELKVLAEQPGPEQMCNHAQGTLVGVSVGPGFDRAGLYPASSHAALSTALSSGVTYPRYYCESHFVGAADAAGYVCKISRTSPRCVGQRVQFPEGPLKHGVPRPSSAGNAFCLSCHDNANPSFTMKTAALSFTPGLLLENDRRRQPMQPSSRLFGMIPAHLFGPGLPATTLSGGAAGLKVDLYVLPAGP
ncbi:MAG: hypothetical protein R3B48_16125 [Kofleriaceae bacterium]